MKSLSQEYSLFVVRTKPIAYEVALAWSLILEANTQADFHAWFIVYLKEHLPATEIQARGFSDLLISSIPMNLHLLAPYTTSAAMRRTKWLMQHAQDGTWPAAKESVALLSDWSGIQTQEHPKNVVIGMAPTRFPVGIVGKMTGKARMMIVADRTYVSNHKLTVDITQKAVQTSLSVLQHGLESVNGNIKKIEPELADWFYGTKQLCFYAAESSVISSIQKELDEIGISYSTTEENSKPVLLAISPVLNDEHAALFWNAEPLLTH